MPYRSPPSAGFFVAQRKVKMAQDVQGMLVRIEATTAQLRAEMAKADQAVGSATKNIDGQLSRADRAFDRLNRNSSSALGSIGKNFDLLAISVKAATATMAAFGVGASFTRFMTNTQNAEKEQAQLAAVLRSTGEAAGYSASQLNDMASRMAKSTTYAAGAVTTAQTAMLAFTGIVGDEFTRAMDSAANMSARTGMSLAQTAELIGRALDVPSKGMASLSRQGFRFSEDQRELMKQLEATGRTAEAQGIILAALEESYGGAAAAARNTLVGALAALGNSFDDLLTGSNNALSGVTAAVNAINNALSRPEARIAIAALGDALIAVSAVMAGRVVASGISAAGAFMAAQVQAVRYQFALAKLSGVSTTAAVAITATATAARAASAAMALVGGPLGAALLAASAIAYYSMRSREAVETSTDLSRSVEGLAKEFRSLSRAQAENRLQEMVDDQRKLQDALNDTTSDLGRQFVRLDKWGANFTAGQKQRTEAWQNFLRAIKNGADVGEAAARLAEVTGASEEMRAKIITATAAIETQAGQASKNAQVITVLKNTLSELTDETRANTTAQAQNNIANLEGIEAGEKYLKQLETQLNRMKDKTAVQAAERVLTDNQIDRQSELGQKILATAAAQDAQRAADAKLTSGIKTGNKAIDERIKAIDALIAKYDPATKAQDDYEKAVALADEALLKGKYTTEQYQKVIQGLYTDLNKPIWDEHNKQAKEAADAIKKIDDQLESVRDRLDPVRAATNRLTAEKKLLKEALDKNRMSFEEYQLRLQQLDKEYQQNTRATSEWAKWTEGALDRVDSAFADAWRNIGDGFSSFRDSLTNAFKQMLAELAHMAITKPIVIQIGAAIGIGGGAGQAVSMMGGGGVNYGQLASYGQSAYSALTGWGQAAYTGWQNGGVTGAYNGVTGYYGDMFSGAYNTVSGALGYGNGANIAGYTGQAYANWAAGGSQAIGASQAGYTGAQYSAWVGQQNAAATAGTYAPWLSAASGAYMGYQQSGAKGAVAGGVGGWGGAKLGASAGSYFGPIGTAVGAVLGGVLGSIGGSKIFGGDWQTKDVGLALSVQDGDFVGQQYEYQKKKGGLFGSNKKRTRYSALDEETAAALQEVYDATEDTVAGLFESLSYSVEEASLAGLQLARTEISTKGKTEEEIQQAIAEWFGSAADAMTAELNNVFATGLDLDFEGMQAFVGNLQGVNEVLRYLDVGMYDASVAGGKLAESLSAAAGGLEALAANSATYYDAFFSEAEKIEDTIDSIERAFESADVELAESREAYRAMVEDIDLTTEAGQQMFATMMALSGHAAQYYSIVEQQAAAAAAQALANTQLYYDQFTTAAEKADDVLAGVAGQFAAMEVSLPATRAGFISAVDALDRSTEAGQRMFSVLMGAAGAADAYYDILEARAASVSAGTANAAIAASRGALGTLSAAINAEKSSIAGAYQSQANSIRSAIGSANDSLSQMRSVAGSLRSAVNGLRLESEQYAAQSRRSAQQTIGQALSAGGRGVLARSDLAPEKRTP